MTDGGGWWSRPGDDAETSPWWTPSPSPTPRSGSGWPSGVPARRRSWRDSSPTWPLLVLVSAVTAVLGGTIGGVIAHHGSGDSTPTEVRIGAVTTPAAVAARPAGSTAAVAARILPSVVSIE